MEVIDLIFLILGKIGWVLLILALIAIAQYGIIMMLPREKREKVVRDLIGLDEMEPIERVSIRILFNL